MQFQISMQRRWYFDSSGDNSLSGNLVAGRKHAMEASPDAGALCDGRPKQNPRNSIKAVGSPNMENGTHKQSAGIEMNDNVSEPPPRESNESVDLTGECAQPNASDESPEDAESQSLADDSMSDSSTGSSSTAPQHEQDSEASANAALGNAILSYGSKKILLDRLYEAATRGTLSLINFSRRGLSPNDALLLKRVIVTNPHLSVLKLGYNNLGDEGTTIIASALLQGNNHHSLSVLDLGFNDIGDTGCECLVVNAVAGNFHLRTLYLSGNNIGQKGALSIAGAILHGSCISSLHLSANKIGDVGVKAIAAAIAECEARANLSAGQIDAMNSCRIEQLDFGSTSMSSIGFVGIPNMLLSNRSMRVLCVTNNGIDDRDMAVFAQAVSQSENIPLESLQLSFNQITCVGVECLMNAIWGSKTLREIKLDNNKIQDRGAQLCAVVLTSVRLETLDISFNRVTTVGVRALMKSLSENSSLLSVAVCGIPIDQNASKAVSYALAYNQTLRSFYMDNCSAGYSAQRHIVAGIVSNRSGSLRVLTGFPLGPITVTLGMPHLPESWSNDQVLGFARLMWRQWREKQNIGSQITNVEEVKGPAPPAAVAAAAKMALASLGDSPAEALHSEPYEKEIAQTSPLVPTNAALLERTFSGTLRVPAFSDMCNDGDVPNTIEAWSESFRNRPVQPTVHSAGRSSSEFPLENPERRNQNLRWLRVNYRALIDIGQLPFNNADLWQLHQYYFSPPYFSGAESDVTAQSLSDANTDTSHQSHQSDASTMAAVQRDGIARILTLEDKSIVSQGDNIPKCLPQAEPELNRRPPSGTNSPPTTPDVSDASRAPSLGRAISFQTLTTAVLTASAKRKSESQYKENTEPAAKRAKKLKPRISYYPRIKAKLESLGAKPLEQTLSLLRKLKYIESVMFPDNNAYDECAGGRDPHQPTRSDVEMILLDLL